MKKYKEGIYKLKVTAINEDGESNTKASDMISIDFSNPSCENIKLTEGIKGWSNKDKTFSVDCVMTDGSACPTQTVTKKFTKDANSGYIKISDGKKTTYCQVDVKIDKTAPTCTVKSSSTGWTNKYVALTGTCTDNLSGCQKSSISTKITNETNSNVSPGSVYDNAGNKTDCGKKLVQIDKTVPTCEIKYSDYITDKWTKYITLKPSNLFWTTHSRKINVKCNDKDGSECTLDNIEKIYNNNYFKNEYNDVIKTKPKDSVEIKDKAENTENDYSDIIYRWCKGSNCKITGKYFSSNEYKEEFSNFAGGQNEYWTIEIRLKDRADNISEALTLNFHRTLVEK